MLPAVTRERLTTRESLDECRPGVLLRFDLSTLISKIPLALLPRPRGWRTLTGPKSREAVASQVRARAVVEERPLFEAIAVLRDRAAQCAKLHSIIS
jgi:hypothetical protein